MQLVNTTMERMQVEADLRADAMLQTVVQMLKNAPAAESNKAAPIVGTDATSGQRTLTAASPGQHQPSWATVTGTGTQRTSSSTTVTNGKKKVKKHPLDQRRILFVRNVQNHTCDPRDIMFEINKALAHARANVTVRLIKMGYTAKGNLTGMIGENACAETFSRMRRL